ncbi:MAG: exodeoxyribonuclease VII small subunit [Oscillospiraceae bacterium]|nr:exodeoxyribonuclease VII small subunit [Candidatus Ruminococcus equi]
MKKDMTYEEAQKELSAIVEKMESDETTLDESMKLYEKAYELIAYCNELLKTAKGEITTIHERIEKLGIKENLFED